MCRGNSMTNDRRLVVVTGSPGAGKSTIGVMLYAWHKAIQVKSYTTRPLRPGENNLEKEHLTDEEYRILLSQERIFHPTRTVNQDGTEYLRGFPPLEEWPCPILGTEFTLLVCGPRCALEVKARVPKAVCVFLTARPEILITRIRDRMSHDNVTGYARKIMEYAALRIEDQFEYVIETEGVSPAKILNVIEKIAALSQTRVSIPSDPP